MLRNVRLTAELHATIDDPRASRRPVQAQDDERQQIERNLHDGAQQQLVALTGQLGQFSVADDGAGFDPAAAAHGTGLQGMADRLSAVGGQLGIASAPGLGTTISGTVPVAAVAPAMAD